ncbi:pirin family protein [Chryseobacterium sp. PTM-20240506]|uniref:pirin family protein n=1 Tax=unclassified Chryseobacterium TaxID=2593645 RepID=UPI002359E9FE|nr:pirin family protein [Chryseobacterium sp. B21-037]MDC8103395.1 pirin family protein [Chryseobacterium sp. B21-037]
MKIIKASEKHTHGNSTFQVEILYPGANLDKTDTGFFTIGRIDHALFKPPGLVPMHPHQNDEILSYMRSGKMIHKDSTGHEEHLNSSYMMMMNAGSGISHEESSEENVEMLQIFMRPTENDLPPKVQFHQFENIYSDNIWRLVAGNQKHAPLKLRVETNIFDIRLNKKNSIKVPENYDKIINFLYCFNGNIKIGNETVTKGDSVIFEENLIIEAETESNLVLFQIKKNAEYSDTGMFSGNKFYI